MIHWRTVARGAGLAVAIAVAAIAGWEITRGVVDVDAESNWAFLPYLVVMGGLVAGGHRSARHRLDAPLTHGALAAMAAYLAVALVSTAFDVARGDPPDPVALVFNGLMSASAGMFGGMLAIRRGGRFTIRRASGPRAPAGGVNQGGVNQGGVNRGGVNPNTAGTVGADPDNSGATWQS